MSPAEKSHSSGGEQLVEVAAGWTTHTTLFVTCLFVISAVLVKIIYRRSRLIAALLPESCVFILAGSALDYLLSQMSTAVARLKPTFTIDIFFAILLPPIMLESAYSLNQKHFYLNVVPVLMYAIIGTLFNILFLGPSLFAMEQLKWMHIPSVSLLELTIFGASISAIDPVSVLAIFKNLRVKRSLYYLVFGESLLNDAVVLVIHRILLDMLASERPAFSARVLFLGIAKFGVVSGGSLAIGLFFGIASAVLTLATKHVEDAEPILLFILAYTAYVSAEIFEWSGVVSIIGCGLVQAEFALRNIAYRSRITVHNYIQTLSATSDGIIFLFIGMVIVQTKHYWNVAFILFTIAFCLVYRLLSVFSLTFIANHVITGATYVSFREQLLMVHGGLRGAIAYILISMLVDREQSQPDKSKNVTATGRTTVSTAVGAVKTATSGHGPWHGPFSILATVNELANRPTGEGSPRVGLQMLQTTTLVVIMTTVFVMGSTTKPLLKYLQIKREVDSHGNSLFCQLNNQMFDDTSEFIRRIVSDKKASSCLYRAFRWLNRQFLKPFLVRKAKYTTGEADEEEDEESDSDDDDNEGPPLFPANGTKTHGHNSPTDQLARVRTASQREAPSTACWKAAISEANTSYERILRNYLAKQLRHKARSMAILRTEPSRSSDQSNGNPANGREMVHARQDRVLTASRLRHRYENDTTANLNKTVNKMRALVCPHSPPERVITIERSSARRPSIKSGQQWRSVPNTRLGSIQVESVPWSATIRRPPATAWAATLPSSQPGEARFCETANGRPATTARQSTAILLQPGRLPTANGLLRYGRKRQSLLPLDEPNAQTEANPEDATVLPFTSEEDT